MGKFEPGNKFAKGGKRPGAGPPTKAEIAEKESLLEALLRLREERALRLAQAYLDMAEGEKNETATMRHLIDRVMPPVERHEHSGEIGVKSWVMDAYKPKKKEKK